MYLTVIPSSIVSLLSLCPLVFGDVIVIVRSEAVTERRISCCQKKDCCPNRLFITWPLLQLSFKAQVTVTSRYRCRCRCQLSFNNKETVAAKIFSLYSTGPEKVGKWAMKAWRVCVKDMLDMCRHDVCLCLYRCRYCHCIGKRFSGMRQELFVNEVRNKSITQS